MERPDLNPQQEPFDFNSSAFLQERLAGVRDLGELTLIHRALSRARTRAMQERDMNSTLGLGFALGNLYAGLCREVQDDPERAFVLIQYLRKYEHDAEARKLAGEVLLAHSYGLTNQERIEDPTAEADHWWALQESEPSTEVRQWYATLRQSFVRELSTDDRPDVRTMVGAIRQLDDVEQEP
jgi:hypothetical protein